MVRRPPRLARARHGARSRPPRSWRVSYLLAPDPWSQWIEKLLAPSVVTPTWLTAILGPLWLRVPLAAAIAFVGGLAGYRWPVAVSVLVAVPSLWTGSLSILVALIPLIAMDRRDPLPAMWPGRMRSGQAIAAAEGAWPVSRR